MREPEDVRALGHEMHAAEHDVLGLRMPGDLTRELEGVAGVVREADHLVALVVVAEDDEALAQRTPRRRDARRHFLVRQPQVTFGKGLPFPDACLLHLVENR